MSFSFPSTTPGMGQTPVNDSIDVMVGSLWEHSECWWSCGTPAFSSAPSQPPDELSEGCRSSRSRTCPGHLG